VRVYLVVDRLGNALYRSSKDGVLWSCGPRRAATLFPTAASAARSVRRSLDYSAENGCRWAAGEYKVVPVELPEPAPRRARLLAAVRWALGEAGSFRARPDGAGPYWWRGELRRRAGL
jgi:hypothetical protein